MARFKKKLFTVSGVSMCARAWSVHTSQYAHDEMFF